MWVWIRKTALFKLYVVLLYRNFNAWQLLFNFLYLQQVICLYYNINKHLESAILVGIFETYEATALFQMGLFRISK
jgi:hypothetical protein